MRFDKKNMYIFKLKQQITFFGVNESQTKIFCYRHYTIHFIEFDKLKASVTWICDAIAPFPNNQYKKWGSMHNCYWGRSW